MDEFLKMFEGLIETSKQNAAHNPKPISNKWKFCVALSKIGWKAFSCEKVDKESNDIVVKWKKEGKQDISIKLSFFDQCLWLEYLDKKGRKK